ncbi:hypothetical protein [Bradyrhizobium elkanii]|uniref:hypothetical protein n=1 Tax=Bradyrhizobium elkanii TaxID=29448 RepID=UPI003D2175FC
MMIRAAIIALLGLALYVSFYPGSLNYDTIDIIRMGFVGDINDWHSPAASEFARWLYPVGMPDAFLIVQVAVAAYFAVEFVALLPRKSVGALSAIAWAIGLYTTALVVLCAAYVVKDMWIAILFAACGVRLTGANRKGWQVVADLALIAIAVLVRPACIIPAVPLVVASIASTRRVGWKVGAGASAVCVVLILALPAVVKNMSGARSDHPESPLFMYDIIGIGMRTVEPAKFVNDRLNSSYSLPELKQCYSAETVEPFLWGACPIDRLKLPLDHLVVSWAKAIMEHPAAYLRHRVWFNINLFESVDQPMGGWFNRPMFYEAEAGINSPRFAGQFPLPAGMKISMTPAESGVVLTSMVSFERAVSFLGMRYPLAWVLLSIVSILVVVSGGVARTGTAAIAVAVSSLLNTASFMALASYNGGRYLTWSMIGGVLSLTLAIVAVQTRKRATS